MPRVPKDNADSEGNVFKDILEKETDPLVSFLQSCELPSESKGVKVDSESWDVNPKYEKLTENKSLSHNHRLEDLIVFLKPRYQSLGITS